MSDLFVTNQDQPSELCPDVYLWRQYAPYAHLSAPLQAVIKLAPLRFMHTPGGRKLNISMTNCGQWGWVSLPCGYQYSTNDPRTQQPWPTMPRLFSDLGSAVAKACGFPDFQPNACLINHYQAGQTLSPHQDKNEGDFSQPIVSVSLGMSALFQIGGNSRRDPMQHIELFDGDVMVWGRSARLMYHGVKTQHSSPHPSLGLHRFNLTLRQVSKTP